MIISGFTLDLYCGVIGCNGGEHGLYPTQQTYYAKERASTARRLARHDGWLFLSGDVICPTCNKAKRKLGE